MQIIRTFNSVCRRLKYRGWRLTERLITEQGYDVATFRDAKGRGIQVVKTHWWPAPDVHFL